MDELKPFLVGDGLLGRVIDANAAPQDGRGPLTDVRAFTQAARGELTAAATTKALWETGIKAVDFYAPIPVGGTFSLVASPGVGLVVAMAELTQRIAAQGGCTVLAELDDEAYPVAETVDILRGGGVEASVALLYAARGSSLVERRQLVRAALAAAEDFCTRGRHVMLVVGEEFVLPQTVGDLRARLRRTAHGSLTLALTFWRHTTPETELAPELQAWLAEEVDAQVVLSRALALQGIWPAVDGLSSRSRLLDQDTLAAQHGQTVAAARQLLGHLSRAEGVTSAAARERAQRILLFGGQPFVVAEPYTARPGRFVTYAETLHCYAGIVAGAYDHLPEEAFRFTGAL